MSDPGSDGSGRTRRRSSDREGSSRLSLQWRELPKASGGSFPVGTAGYTETWTRTGGVESSELLDRGVLDSETETTIHLPRVIYKQFICSVSLPFLTTHTVGTGIWFLFG